MEVVETTWLLAWTSLDNNDDHLHPSPRAALTASGVQFEQLREMLGTAMLKQDQHRQEGFRQTGQFRD